MSKKAYRKFIRSGERPCDICKRITLLVTHHIKGREVWDANKEYNLAHICPNCHDKVHMNLITHLQWQMTSDGRILLFVLR